MISRNPILVRDIIRATAAHEQIRYDDIVGPCRQRRFAWPRHRAMYLARRLRPDASLPLIGRIMGGRDHTTVLHGVRRVKRLLDAGNNQEHMAIADITAEIVARYSFFDEEVAALSADIDTLEAQLAELREARRLRIEHLEFAPEATSVAWLQPGLFGHA